MAVKPLIFLPYILDMAPLNNLTLELSTVLDEISAVQYQRAIKQPIKIKKKPVKYDFFLKEAQPKETNKDSIFSGKKGARTIGSKIIDAVSGLNVIIPKMGSDQPSGNAKWDEDESLQHPSSSKIQVSSRKMSYIDQIGSLDYIFDSKGSGLPTGNKKWDEDESLQHPSSSKIQVSPTKMSYIDQIGGLDYIFDSKISDSASTMDNVSKMSGHTTVHSQNPLSGESSNMEDGSNNALSDISEEVTTVTLEKMKQQNGTENKDKIDVAISEEIQKKMA